MNNFFHNTHIFNTLTLAVLKERQNQNKVGKNGFLLDPSWKFQYPSALTVKLYQLGIRRFLEEKQTNSVTKCRAYKESWSI